MKIYLIIWPIIRFYLGLYFFFLGGGELEYYIYMQSSNMQPDIGHFPIIFSKCLNVINFVRTLVVFMAMHAVQ